MKKLKLKNLKLDSKDLLQRNQLKTVFGGYGGYGGGDGCCTTNCVSVSYSCANGVAGGVGIRCTCNWNHQTLYSNLGNVACQGSC